ncbi:MAG: hypothetical protein ABI390_00095 [Daejeonella sp.]
MKTSDIIASIGVTLLLIAFFLNLKKKLKTEDKIYIILNIVGAGMCGVSSYMIKFYPFVLLEGVWATVAAASLFKSVSRETLK